MTSKIIWMCESDSSIKMNSSDECRDIAEKFPLDPKYRTWVQVLIIENEVAL